MKIIVTILMLMVTVSLTAKPVHSAHRSVKKDDGGKSRSCKKSRIEMIKRFPNIAGERTALNDMKEESCQLILTDNLPHKY